MEQSCLPYGNQEENGGERGGKGERGEERGRKGGVKESGDQIHL